VKLAALIASGVVLGGASLAGDRHWIDRETGLSMVLADGFTPDEAASDGKGRLSVESSANGVYRVCTARIGPDGEQVAATIRELGADPQWVRSVCEDTAYPPEQNLKNRNYLAGASDDSELGPRHSCIVAYEVDDAELRSLGLSYVIRQASMMTAGAKIVNMNCSLAAKNEAVARAHWPVAETAFGAMRGSISSAAKP
jgi:hypothetical protein